MYIWVYNLSVVVFVSSCVSVSPQGRRPVWGEADHQCLLVQRRGHQPSAPVPPQLGQYDPAQTDPTEERGWRGLHPVNTRICPCFTAHLQACQKKTIHRQIQQQEVLLVHTTHTQTSTGRHTHNHTWAITQIIPSLPSSLLYSHIIEPSLVDEDALIKAVTIALLNTLYLREVRKRRENKIGK